MPSLFSRCLQRASLRHSASLPLWVSQIPPTRSQDADISDIRWLNMITYYDAMFFLA